MKTAGFFGSKALPGTPKTLNSRPCTLALYSFGTRTAILASIALWIIRLAADFTPLFCTMTAEFEIQISVRGQDGSEEVSAPQRLAYALRADTRFSIIQKQAVAVITVGTFLNGDVLYLPDKPLRYMSDFAFHSHSP